MTSQIDNHTRTKPDLIDTKLIDQFNLVAAEQGLLPVKVTPYYRRLVEQEVAVLGRVEGPLYRAVYPTTEKLYTHVGNEVPDFVDDRLNMPGGLDNVIVHKYGNRALFLVTDKCIGHCMYCFRQDVMLDSINHKSLSFESKLDGVIRYLQSAPHIEELILSGGDPMSLQFSALEKTLTRIRQETAVKHIRMHTRNIAFAPNVYTSKHAALFALHNVRLYLHFIHPYEITDEVKEVVLQFRQAGVKLNSQFPILRNINDHVDVLKELLVILHDIDAPPINIFIPDPISYSASFRLNMQRLLDMMDEFYWSTPSWINGVRLVLDTPIGKVRREDIVHWNKDNGEITFSRDGNTTIYHDFPEELDVPGDPSVMLWKGLKN